MNAIQATVSKHLNPWIAHAQFKAFVIAACIAPALWTLGQVGWILYSGDAAGLGANPIETILRRLGLTALILLCLCLAVTPLRNMFKLPKLLAVRRALGVSTFAYGTLHLLAYSGWDMSFNLADITADIIKRPFIWMGMITWVLMLPLAATSFNRAIRWMGGKRWTWQHKAVYAVAIAAVVHFIWMKAGKNNFDEPFKYAALVAVLLTWRVWNRFKPKAQPKPQVKA